MAFSDERDYAEEAANRRLMTEEQEDSYLDETHDDASTYGADYVPEEDYDANDDGPYDYGDDVDYPEPGYFYPGYVDGVIQA